jgi:hypothetical protein
MRKPPGAVVRDWRVAIIRKKLERLGRVAAADREAAEAAAIEQFGLTDHERKRLIVEEVSSLSRMDINDGKPWSELDLDDLRQHVASGATLEETASFLCRLDTAFDVAEKAKDLGLRWQRGGVRRRPTARAAGAKGLSAPMSATRPSWKAPRAATPPHHPAA